MQRVFHVVAATALCCAPAALHAQDDASITEPVSAQNAVAAEGPESAASSDSATGTESSPQVLTVPSFTEVAIEILADLGSKTSTKGQMFPIRLVNAIYVDGREVVPAGTEGMGEVIHAKSSGGMGAAGELILTARYLRVGDRQLPLRTFRVGGTAHDRIGMVDTIAVASAASPLPIAFVGFFIKGNQLTIASGTVATARTAMDFSIELPPTPEAVAPEAPAASSEAENSQPESATGEVAL